MGKPTTLTQDLPPRNSIHRRGPVAVFTGIIPGKYHCPVLTHIVAVKTKENVFCYEAIKESNIKTKNWKELLTDETFTREDLITIQVCSAES
ncbi:Peptidyl-prolyl cis-trans isomerase CYP65 [Camellia lanceoleosa]|uniref:Peptidyl-prolyl cis-trans isomerase CYP65 n=1 Tax=Camellia lanceoleosa TaxID=1840588 RepID=A0ACC0IY39_9ERIC|nr:Peptidyl-prolyl cis-trans isomerase CYP65 [Camellia lanceoleosa]